MSLPETIKHALDEIRAFVEAVNWDEISDRRLEILKVFLQLAAAQGYSAVTMRSLAAKLKLKAPSIYSHFPDGKEEIIAHSLRWQASVFGREVLRGTAPARDVTEFLDALTRTHCAMNIQNRENSLWDMIVASDRVGKFLPIELRDEMHDWITLCTKLYMVAAVELGVSEADLKARQVMTAIDGVHGWATWDGSPAELGRILGEATRLCCTILGVPARTSQSRQILASRDAQS